ncbi:MAG: hypothetical protein WD766_02405 [Gemmatimonadota bacterium]
MKESEEPGISKVKLAIGAASLFLFVVGVKRTFRTEEGATFEGFDELPPTGAESRLQPDPPRKGGLPMSRRNRRTR